MPLELEGKRSNHASFRYVAFILIGLGNDFFVHPTLCLPLLGTRIIIITFLFKLQKIILVIQSCDEHGAVQTLETYAFCYEYDDEEISFELTRERNNDEE